MLYSLTGRVAKSLLAGGAPAPEVLFAKRQGSKSLLAWDSSCPGSSIHKMAGVRKLAGQGTHLPRKLIFQTGRVRRASWPGDTPASEALFEKRQGRESLLGGECSCPRSPILKPAGCVELAGWGWLLPQKLYSKNGRVRRACWARDAPAPEALFTKRQETTQVMNITMLRPSPLWK